MKIEDEIKQSSPFKSEHHKLMVNLMFTGKWISDIIYKDLKSFGVTSQQYNVLRILRGQKQKAISVNSISDRMIDRMSNVSRLVDKLKAKGLVNRQTSTADKRHVDIVITQKGLDLLKKIDESDVGLLHGIKGLNEKEAANLNRLLDKMRN